MAGTVGSGDRHRHRFGDLLRYIHSDLATSVPRTASFFISALIAHPLMTTPQPRKMTIIIKLCTKRTQMVEQSNFIFIVDSELRQSLENDYRELQLCLEHHAWKAAHVLSGSIVEAVLVDYLLGAGYSNKDPLKMTLEDLIDAAKTANVLSAKTADLSSVVRSYRNLIHPGRLVRLGETTDEEGAQIANSLVAIIVREVAKKQEQTSGLTAEQLLAKFENDPSALAISDHLLRDAKPEELERLLLAILPTRYLELDSFDFDEG